MLGSREYRIIQLEERVNQLSLTVEELVKKIAAIEHKSSLTSNIFYESDALRAIRDLSTATLFPLCPFVGEVLPTDISTEVSEWGGYKFKNPKPIPFPFKQKNIEENEE